VSFPGPNVAARSTCFYEVGFSQKALPMFRYCAKRGESVGWARTSSRKARGQQARVRRSSSRVGIRQTDDGQRIADMDLGFHVELETIDGSRSSTFAFGPMAVRKDMPVSAPTNLHPFAGAVRFAVQSDPAPPPKW
jgi:hypothetical protein